MSKFIVKPSKLQGMIAIPPSKSHTLRAILFATLAEGTSVIHNYLPSTDTQTMINACRLLGAGINVLPTFIEVQGVNGHIKHAEDVIDAGNSGIVLRFCTAIGALSSHPIVITGDHSIRHQRPMQPLLEGLQQLGVSAVSTRGDGFAPIIIRGPLRTGKTTLNGQDSQPISALLIAAAFAEGPIDIHVKEPGEKPWISLTLDWFDRLGISYVNNNFEHYQMQGGTSYEGFEYTVPGDFSSAAFPIAAALVTQSELTLKNIDMHDAQGDKELISIFQKMGADIIIDDTHKTLHVKKGKKLVGISVDINRFVDAITILAVVACYAEGETVIYNGAIARQKECNRIQCIATELTKMGAHIEETEDGLKIIGKPLHRAEVTSYHDHRMVMSLAVAALGCSGETTISDVECIAKTFPTFMQDFQQLGAHIQMEKNHG